MSKVVVAGNLTFEGVLQAPGRPGEERRGGFEHGGWAVPCGDSVLAREMGEGMAKGGALLPGRRTYEDFAAFWPYQKDNRFRLFADRSSSAALRLAGTVTTATGVVLAAYQRGTGAGHLGCVNIKGGTPDEAVPAQCLPA